MGPMGNMVTRYAQARQHAYNYLRNKTFILEPYHKNLTYNLSLYGVHYNILTRLLHDCYLVFMRLSGDELFSAGPNENYVNEITHICVCLFVFCLFVCFTI